MTDTLERTPLNRWHHDHGAKMAEFGGWEMPIHYPRGILEEHRATRGAAGLFDVSHMGRFRVRGSGAEDYLAQTLTNQARALAPGQAHYTMLATETGGAVDDAYLYRLASDDFLLVVNAANRARDWAWLERRRAQLDRGRRPGGVRLSDQSDDYAMLALQGPGSDTVLGQLVGAGELPEARRNRHRTVAIAGSPTLVARTGYTGEALGYEMFPLRPAVVELWERLVAAGATPVGLGARDSLRLEACLPLYGHELGRDPDGAEIPIFANRLARFAVRRAGGDDYPGRAALERQRTAVLPRLIQPIAVRGSRRPLRPGQPILCDRRAIGWVTSGSVVPAAGGLRPIGLALIDTPVARRIGQAVDVLDARGKPHPATVVEDHLTDPTEHPGGSDARSF